MKVLSASPEATALQSMHVSFFYIVWILDEFLYRLVSKCFLFYFRWTLEAGRDGNKTPVRTPWKNAFANLSF